MTTTPDTREAFRDRQHPTAAAFTFPVPADQRREVRAEALRPESTIHNRRGDVVVNRHGYLIGVVVAVSMLPGLRYCRIDFGKPSGSFHRDYLRSDTVLIARPVNQETA